MGSALRRLVAMVAVAAAPAVAFAGVPSYRDVVASYRSSETAVVDRHGEVVQVVRTDRSARRLAWTPLVEVSPALRTALVYSEDRRFYEHSGVDWRAVGAAAWGNLWNTRTRGASTITMQLAGLVDDGLRASSGGRSIAQKLSQAATAVGIEQRWKKDEILEAYLNLVGYRGELVGIGALAATLFEKYPSGLDAREGAIAAALVRAPNAPPARVAERACEILQAQSLPDECRGLADYTAMVLARRAAPRLDSDPQIAPHFARRVLAADERAKPRPVVTTTLDAGLQRFARTALRTQLAELAGRNVEDGAVLVLDNATGDVLAWVGSSGDLSGASALDHVTSPRQAGSTLKPFLYELAIEKRWLTAASILDDSPVDLATAGGLYIPQDYDHTFKGPVSVRTALGASLNVPAVRTLVMVTPERFHQRLRRLGFSTLRESGDYYGYSLALGSAEVTLADLTNAYRALAERGATSPIRTVPSRAPPARSIAMDPAATFIVDDILADRNARTPTFGMDSVLSTRRWSAVKTGTSKDMRDNWCVGFTERYTVGVWVGNSSGEAMWDVSGTTGAAPVWRAVVEYLSRGPGQRPTVATQDTPGVAMHRTTFTRGTEAARDELYLDGTATPRVTALGPASSVPNGRITTPVDGTVIALDPDIPEQRQRLTIAASGGGALRWRIDGRDVAKGPNASWPPWPGRHRVELVDDAGGAVLDSVAFEIRGASIVAKSKRRSQPH